MAKGIESYLDLSLLKLIQPNNDRMGVRIFNSANAKYFTRRINMYPGPDILPADERSAYVSVGVKL